MRNFADSTRAMVSFLCVVVCLAEHGMPYLHSSRITAESSTPQLGNAESTITQILETILKWQKNACQSKRPFVTLSFAQSIDGKIAMFTDASKNQTSSNFPISGPDSLWMTHGLRSIHDAILVGGRTLSTDNPRLSNRLWKSSDHQPRPVVLDTHLSHIRSLETMRAQDLIICCSQKAALSCQRDDSSFPPSATLLPCPVVDGSLDLAYVLSKLRTEFSIQSVMVEGGAQVLSMFMNQGLADCFCVTITPKLFGVSGLSAYSCCWSRKHNKLNFAYAELDESKFLPLGEDCILLGKWFVRPLA